MKRQYFKKAKMPDKPGIYTFRDAQKKPLYIGRATSLRDRVKSYFSHDLIKTRGLRIVDMVAKARLLTYKETGSVLEAIIMESNLIKKHQPYYNIDEKDDKSSQYVVITDESWPRVFLERVRDLDQAAKNGQLPYSVKRKFGPYPDSGLIKEALKILRRLFPFRDKKASDPRHEAFYRALGRTPKQRSETDRRKYLRLIQFLILFFEGKKRAIRNGLENDMREQAADMRFEEAHATKKLIRALDHINDIALIKSSEEDLKQSEPLRSESFRIEAYDIAHLSGTHVVGGFVVSENGQFKPSEYRKFKLHVDKNDDVGNLGEIIFRRLNHEEWRYPDLIVVDGGVGQLKRAEAVIKSRNLDIPVVAVTKDERHKAIRIVGHERSVHQFKKEIIVLNAEAHRFAVAYHRKHRSLTYAHSLSNK